MTATLNHEAISRALDVLEDSLDPSRVRDRHRMTLQIAEVPEQTLNAMVERLLASDQQDRAALATAIIRQLRSLDPDYFGRTHIESGAVDVANLVAFAAEVCAIDRTQFFPDHCATLGRGLYVHEKSRRTGGHGRNYLLATQPQRDAAAACILTVHLLALSAQGTADDWRGLSSALAAPGTSPAPRLLATVRRHIADPHRILEAAVERRSADPDVLGPLLDPETPALAEGHL